MLDELPIEILEEILTYIPAKSDLKSLCEVSKYLLLVVRPKLYRSITIKVSSEDKLNAVDFVPFLRTSLDPEGSDFLVFLKEIRIVAPISVYRFDRCEEVMMDCDMCPCQRNERHCAAFLGRISKQLNHIFCEMPENSLRSFGWELGTCIPLDILGGIGLFKQFQSRIDTLRLITDATCKRNDLSPTGLEEFRHLRHLSWKGLSLEKDFKVLKACLRNNRKKLEVLEIVTVELGEEPDVLESDDYFNFFAERVLGITSSSSSSSSNGSGMQFPSLRHLSLGHLSFQSAFKGMATSLNVSALRSLKLYRCRHTFSLLDHIVKSKQTMRLKSFEIVLDGRERPLSEAGDEHKALITFLTSFEGLEELCVLILKEIVLLPLSYLIPVYHHKSSLKRIIYHTRPVVGEALRDVWDPEYLEHLTEFVPTTKLEFIGINVNVTWMSEMLENASSYKTVKVLHIRKSGIDHVDLYYASEFHERYHSASDARLHPDSSNNNASAETAHVNNEPHENGNHSSRHDQSDRDHEIETDGSSTPPASVVDGYYAEQEVNPDELIEIADRAFGPNGLPNLSILAYGDFSYDDRYPDFQVLLCRDEDEDGAFPFRIMTAKDEHLWDRIDGGREILGACPVGDLILGMDEWLSDDGYYVQ